MKRSSVNTKTVAGSHNECYQNSDEDELSLSLEVDGGQVSPGFSLPVLDATGHGTTVVNMRDSTNVEIKPATYFHGSVTIHQYSNGYQTSSQPAVGSPIEKNSNNGTELVNKEELNPRTNLDTTGGKLCHDLRSGVACKLGIIMAATGAVIIGVVIVYFSLLKQDVSDDTIPLPPPEEGETDLGSDIHIFRRERWGGRPIKDGYQNRTLVHPIKLVIIGHTAGHQCTTVADCSSTLQTIQSMHVKKGWIDVGYNYLIGGDGNVYEALAWNIRNYIKGNSIIISFFGNYIYDHVQERQKMALTLLLNQGVNLGKLDDKYLLVAHSQVANTDSPGTYLFDAIKHHPHYYNGTFT